jgi:HlyD family secretion protein
MPHDDSAASGPRSHWVIRAAVLVAVLATAGFAARNLILGEPVDVYSAAITDLTQTVVATGRVATPQRVSVATETTGRVARVPVREGQAVQAGQPLIELEDADERAGVAQAGAAVMQAEARIRQINELASPAAVQALAQAVANAEQARKQMLRVRDLQTQGFVGMAQLDDARRNVDVADSQVAAARLQVATMRPNGSDSALAQAALAQARANLQLAQTKLDQDRVTASADGTLISRNVEVGDIVQPGKELMQLAVSGETQLVVQIDEKNLALLALGQKARVSADAFPGQHFTAELDYINPGVDATRGSVEVKLRVADTPAYLRQDMTVSVDIEVARRAGALVIPTDAVHDIASTVPWVLALRDGRAVHQPIRLGLVGDGRLEVLAGLNDGDTVIPAANATVMAGQRLRARPAPSSAATAASTVAPSAAARGTP